MVIDWKLVAIDKRLIARDFFQKPVSVFLVIDMAAIVVQAVAHDQVAGLQHHVVTHNLVKRLLCDVDGRGLVFHDD